MAWATAVVTVVLVGVVGARTVWAELGPPEFARARNLGPHRLLRLLDVAGLCSLALLVALLVGHIASNVAVF